MFTHTFLPSPAGPARSLPIAVPRIAGNPSIGRSTGIHYKYFAALYASYGKQHWWPARTRFEVVVGAILVQNTSWNNVRGALRNLRRKKLLTVAGIAAVPEQRLAELIRPSGYFRQKARKLKEFVAFLRGQHAGSLRKMFRIPLSELREQLLGVHGIGPETADSILLYAGKQAVFVVDAYTRRIFERHGLAHKENTYEEIRGRVEESLPGGAQVFNEFHALIVHVGKNFCRPKAPLCSECALCCFLAAPFGGPQ